MRLAETGRLGLGASNGDCLWRWQVPEEAAGITPRDLLSHSAGIGLGDFAARYPPEAPRPDLPEDIAQDFALIVKPETGFACSDTGYNLLELVIEECTGEDFGVLMAREVLRPPRHDAGQLRLDRRAHANGPRPARAARRAIYLFRACLGRSTRHRRRPRALRFGRDARGNATEARPKASRHCTVP